eukprot:Sspe_Gene.54721::Locus_30168_Transcript_1_1_Confidence_1.000_Length_756::g.54721::m.54721/K03094/SKP1, CBF3D; S-phase kinase-associated protein 1
MATADKRRVVLVSSDDRKFEVSRQICNMSGLLREILEEQEDDMVEVRVASVNSEVLEKIIEYLTEHLERPFPKIPKPMTVHLFEVLGDSWDRKWAAEIRRAVRFRTHQRRELPQHPRAHGAVHRPRGPVDS